MVDAISYWRATLASECCAENGTVPDCPCPHEHWHLAAAAGSCLDVHLEEDGSAHITFDWGDDSRELIATGVDGLAEARSLAFGWLSGFVVPIPSQRPPLTEICTVVADAVVPRYRQNPPPSCTGHHAKRWQAAWDGACLALGGNPKDHVNG